ncbi:MAG: inorganic phosphate transporter, partial [Candidatus Korarchaeota archaeon]
ANDETMALVAGTRKYKLLYIAIIGGVMDFLGAIILGENVAKTIGKGIPAPGITISYEKILILAVAMATWLTIASLRGFPISTTHSAVGATMGLLLFVYGITGVNWYKILEILTTWIVSPVVGFVSTYLLCKLVHRTVELKHKGLVEKVAFQKKFIVPLLIAGALSSFARGANDSSNACGILYAAESSINPLFVRALTGFAMCIGVIAIGRKVIANVGTKVVELLPSAAFIAQINAAVLELLFAYLGIPLSATHMTVMALVGAGVASKSRINVKTLKSIAYSWGITFPAGALFAVVTYVLVSMFVVIP